MDYQKIYDDLIESRKGRHLENYKEKHHIIPRCLGGKDESNNLIELTYREHYLAHYLLSKIHKKHVGIQYAFLCMLRKHNHGRVITARMYETIKKNFGEFKKWHSKINNPGKSEKSRSSARKRMTERNPISLNPSKNHTCQPIRIHFTDGKIEDFKYAKEFCRVNNVPYATMKHWLRYNKGSKKYNIIRIERLKG